MAIEISADDVAKAETFLETLLTEQIPDGRFTQGTALRDLAIKAFAFIFAHLQRENEEIRSLQSLLKVRDIATADPDTDRAVANATEAILSNWFISRNTGGFARGTITIDVSRRQTYVIPGNNRFIYDRNRAFFPDVADTGQNIVVDASTLIPVVSADGVVTGYQFTLSVIAARAGATYNVQPATWDGGRGFSPFVTSIINTARFQGGKDKESTSELIDRSSNAVSVRNLINNRSIDATLRDEFSSIIRLITIGMGDPEMLRDLRFNDNDGVRLHVGGYYDVYLELPRVQTTFEGILGGVFTRPDGLINVFRDSTITDWTAEAIQLGDILRITDGLPEAPQDFIIREILETEIRVSTLNPFSTATDDAGTFVDYYIYRPLFGSDRQILPLVSVNTQGQTSAKVQTPNRLVLPGGAHYDVIDVAVINPDSVDPNISPNDGLVHFPVRSNEAPNLVISQEYLEYQIVNTNPATAQSALAFEELLLESTYNGKTVRVTYETLANLNTISDYTRNRFRRVLAGNILVKGMHPVYLSMTIPYRLKPTATSTVNQTTLINTIVDFINTFDPNDIIDISDIYQVVRNADSNIGAVTPFTITYTLISPDGRLIVYNTNDSVTLDSAKIIDTSDNGDLQNPQALGISDRVVRYMTTVSRISVIEQLNV